MVDHQIVKENEDQLSHQVQLGTIGYELNMKLRLHPSIIVCPMMFHFITPFYLNDTKRRLSYYCGINEFPTVCFQRQPTGQA